MHKIDLSIVVPLYNEEDNAIQLFNEIKEELDKLNKKYEIIFIDDGSTDNTLNKIKLLSPLKVIKFRKNFGQTYALDAGIKNAKGKYIITMDGDLQNNPKDFKNLIEKLEEGWDVVSGWRKNRKDNIMKNFISKGANYLRKILINDGIHDSGCTLKIYKQECFKNLDLYGEMHRFIPGLLKLKGFKISEIIVDHRKRTQGKTKYGWKRVIKGFLDMIAVWFWRKYAGRPLHLFGTLGILLTFIGFCSGTYAICLKIFYKANLSNTALTDLSMLASLIGIQFIIFGLISHILNQTYFTTKEETPYNIKEIIEN